MATSSADAAYAAQSNVAEIIAVCTVPFAIASIFVFARIYSRAVIIKKLGHDDIWIGISWVFSLLNAALNIQLTKYGTGHHQSLASLPNVITNLKVVFALRIIYPLAMASTKISICIAYKRVFQDRTSRMLVYALTGYTVAVAVASILVTIFQCDPVQGTWDFLIPSKCINTEIQFDILLVGNVTSDIFLLAFVVPRVSKLLQSSLLTPLANFNLVNLQMAGGQKKWLLGIISLSALVIIASIIRYARARATNGDTDFMFVAWQIITWTNIEVDTGLICAAAPGIKPLVNKIAPGFVSSSSGNSKPSSSAWVTRTGRSHTTRQFDGIELSSREDLRQPTDNVITNTFWVGGDSEAGSSTSPGDKSIVKTVSMTVTTDNTDASARNKETTTDNRDPSVRSKEDSVEKFEHV